MKMYSSRQWVEVRGQLHAPATILQGKEPLIGGGEGRGAGWTPELVRMLAIEPEPTTP
jgi:hypothetical protein